MNFEMIWVWVIDTDSSGQNYPGYDKITLFPVDKELRDQYFVTGPCRQQCLLYGQLVLLPAKPASHPVILYPAPALKYCTSAYGSSLWKLGEQESEMFTNA